MSDSTGSPNDPQVPAPAGEATQTRTSRASQSTPTITPKRRLTLALKPRFTRAQILSALLVGLLGFALVVQLQLSQKDEYSGLRQSELINLLDEITRRTDELESEEQRLQNLVGELESGRNTQETARKASEESAKVQGILSGRLPAVGSGITIRVTEGEEPLRAHVLFNILEELRNAGAEAVEVNGIRMVTSSHFADTTQGISVGGVVLSPPYMWKAIGDPSTMQPALEIPGGAMASVRTGTGEGVITQLDELRIDATVEVSNPEFASPMTTDN